MNPVTRHRNHRLILPCAAAAGLWWLCLGGAGQPLCAEMPQRRPNILWIVGENFGLDFQCYGAKNVQTPNVDAMADRGVRYVNAFSTSPVCAPSRSAFMTGMYQTTTDTHHMRSHRDDGFRLPEGVRPITHRLSDAGYYTANITNIGDAVVGTGKLDLNFTAEGPLYHTENWDTLKSHQPFFAMINLPEAEYDIYDRRSAEKDRVVWVGEQWHPKVATEQNVSPPPYYPDHPVVRQEWARYLNSVSGADIRIGKILDRLRTDGMEDDTVVIFFGDNGRLEARGIHWVWDSGIRVPLVIQWAANHEPPIGFAAGQQRDEVVSLIDLTATTLSIAGIKPPIVMQGRPLFGSIDQPERRYAFSARDRIDETEITQRSVHDGRYHYIRNLTPGTGFATLNRYKEKCFLVKPLMRDLHQQGLLIGPAAELMKPMPAESLYDTQADPHEINNLAESDIAEHRETLIRMRTALQIWMTETGDRGWIAEPRDVVAPFEKEMHDWFGTPAWAR